MAAPHPESAGAADPAPAFELKSMGHVLVLLTACGHRLDKIMGQADYINIQRVLIGHGLLDEHGEPTRLGYATGDSFLKKRADAERAAREQAPPAAVLTGKP